MECANFPHSSKIREKGWGTLLRINWGFEEVKGRISTLLGSVFKEPGEMSAILTWGEKDRSLKWGGEITATLSQARGNYLKTRSPIKKGSALGESKM